MIFYDTVRYFLYESCIDRRISRWADNVKTLHTGGRQPAAYVGRDKTLRPLYRKTSWQAAIKSAEKNKKNEKNNKILKISAI